MKQIEPASVGSPLARGRFLLTNKNSCELAIPWKAKTVTAVSEREIIQVGTEIKVT